MTTDPIRALKVANVYHRREPGMSEMEAAIKKGMQEAEQNVYDAMNATVELCAEVCDEKAECYAMVRRAGCDPKGLTHAKETTALLLAAEIRKLLKGKK